MLFYQLKLKEVIYGCMTVILDRKAFSQKKTTKEDAILYFTVCTRLAVPHPPVQYVKNSKNISCGLMVLWQKKLNKYVATNH